MRPRPLLEFRCIVLNPSPYRRMVDLQASFDQQLLDITIGKGVAKVPANGTENDLGCEVPPLEDRRWVGLSHDPSSIAVPLPAVFLQHIRQAYRPMKPRRPGSKRTRRSARIRQRTQHPTRNKSSGEETGLW